MPLLEKIKKIKDAYIYLCQKAEEKMDALSKNKDRASENSWSFWNGVRLNCKQVESDLTTLETETEMALQSVKVDLSALRGE